MEFAHNTLVPNVPSWLRSMNNNARLSTKDIADIFGYKNAKAACTSSSAGCLPEPDYRFKCGYYGTERIFWKPSTIIKEIARRKALMKTSNTANVKAEGVKQAG